MKYKHTIVIAYQLNHQGTLVLHIKFNDDNSARYTHNGLINVDLCNALPGQEIWGTYYQHGSFIYPIFYCKKPKGETKMLLRGQSATTGEEYFELSDWNINDPIAWLTSTVEEI